MPKKKSNKPKSKKTQSLPPIPEPAQRANPFLADLRFARGQEKFERESEAAYQKSVEAERKRQAKERERRATKAEKHFQKKIEQEKLGRAEEALDHPLWELEQKHPKARGAFERWEDREDRRREGPGW